jgi:hypothetical protein
MGLADREVGSASFWEQVGGFVFGVIGGGVGLAVALGLPFFLINVVSSGGAQPRVYVVTALGAAVLCGFLGRAVAGRQIAPLSFAIGVPAIAAINLLGRLFGVSNVGVDIRILVAMVVTDLCFTLGFLVTYLHALGGGRGRSLDGSS